MRITITIGPITILDVVMFETTEDLVAREIAHYQEGEDIDRKLRGDDD